MGMTTSGIPALTPIRLNLAPRWHSCFPHWERGKKECYFSLTRQRSQFAHNPLSENHFFWEALFCADQLHQTLAVPLLARHRALHMLPNSVWLVSFVACDLLVTVLELQCIPYILLRP